LKKIETKKIVVQQIVSEYNDNLKKVAELEHSTALISEFWSQFLNNMWGDF